MRNGRPVLTLILLISVQALCVLPGLGRQTPATLTPSSPLEETGLPASPVPATATPAEESVGTINLVVSQVQSGPPDNLQALEGVQDFYNGYGVQVTDGGKGKLDLNDGTRLTLFNQTEVAGVTVSTAPPEADLFLQNEGFLGSVPPGGRTVVHLPNGAAITILGTQFFVIYNNETGVATAGNFDGSVRFTPPGGVEQELPPATMVNIPPQEGVELLAIPFAPEQFEAAVDAAGTPTAGLTVLVREYRLDPKSFTPVEVARLTFASFVRDVAFSPDSRFVISGGCDVIDLGCEQASARVLDISTGQEITRMDHADQVLAVAFSPDGRHVASGGADDALVVWEALTGEEVTRVTPQARPQAVAFSPDGNYFISGWSNFEEETASVLDTFTGSEVTRVTHERPAQAVAFSPDGIHVVSAGDETARVWEAFTGNEVARTIHSGRFPGIVTSVAFSPDGNYVVSGSCDEVSELCYGGTARVWEAFTGKEVSLVADKGSVNSVAFSPDGRYVAYGSGQATTEDVISGVVLVWEAATGKEILRLDLEHNVMSVAFSPDGNYVVGGSLNGLIRVWNAFTGTEVARMSHDGGVREVLFSPDGRYLASASDDGTARVWLLQTP